MSLTIRPINKEGDVEIWDIQPGKNPKNRKPVGTGKIRASSTIGYVTLITDVELGNAIRIPADWVATLEALDE